MSSKNACPIVYCKSVSPVAVLVALVGMLLIMQGIRGLAASAIFIRVVQFFQTLLVICVTSVLRVFGFIVVIGGLLTPFVGTRLLTSFSAGEHTTVLEQQHHANIGHALSVAGLGAAQSLSGSDSPSVDGSD
jgi:hypothetical protein